MSEHQLPLFEFPLILSRQTLAPLLPQPKIRTWDWVRKYFRTKDGAPFNYIDYPWTEGICDEWDNPRRRTIWLQFCARIGKSLVSQALLTAAIAQNPCPSMIGSSTEGLIKDTIRDKLYPVFERCTPTRSWVPPPHKRGKTRVDLRHAVIYAAWSGSPTSLADKDPRFKWGFEVDKWTKDNSTEADPLELFLERGSEIPDRKTILESTPSIKRHSRVNIGLENGTNARFLVPCKHCGAYQQMVRGNGVEKTGGVIWDKDQDGKSTPAIAYKTARYRCGHCFREWHEEDRKPAIRKGRWCPRGCHVDTKGVVHGSPVNDGPDASFQLSRLYAPTFTFGDYAKHWVESAREIEKIRNHINSWDGEVFEPFSRKLDWEQMAARLSDMARQPNIVPTWGAFLTMAVDVQIDHWVFTVTTWGNQEQGAVINYGTVESWAEVRKLIETSYPHADGGDNVPVRLTLIDARDGNRTDEVIAFCKQVNRDSRWVWPSMGSDATKMSGKAFSKSAINPEKGIARPGAQFWLVSINTGYWEQWAHNCFYNRTPGEAQTITYPSSAATDRDLFEQLMNVQPEYADGDEGSATKKWVRVDRNIPKDLRDAVRYSRVAAEVYTNGHWNRVPSARIAVAKPKPAPGASTEAQKAPFVRKSEGRFVRRPGEDV